jgi:hypothetical protein
MSHYLIIWTAEAGTSSLLQATIAALGCGTSCMPNVILLRHPGPAIRIRKKLEADLAPGDLLLVAELTGNLAWWGVCLTSRKEVIQP